MDRWAWHCSVVWGLLSEMQKDGADLYSISPEGVDWQTNPDVAFP